MRVSHFMFFYMKYENMMNNKTYWVDITARYTMNYITCNLINAALNQIRVVLQGCLSLTSETTNQ